ncbi:Fe-S oxidoreductase [Aureimonas endophytica]|uniref:Fe-S oxidoreductase n=1 Tax=Aureimonas endophytica TaxID=2027858 RepID=A0A916ZV87_9HYPH|nr:(Fe-S)-binding protein [Aureimonas endophytica]GGE15698.1 Fe-S oxidoreductase [Aureimonas endophytica]
MSPIPPSPSASPGARPEVALFVTCLVNVMRPQIAEATIALLEQAGCAVVVPPSQTCCGQPALNAGDAEGAKAMARHQIEVLEPYAHIVVPSGSCTATLAHDYPTLLAGDPVWEPRARALASRIHEVLSFLHDVLGHRPAPVRLEASATYHDTCSGLRELGIRAQPRQLLRSVEGLELRPLPEPDTCCGFGGTFCVKYPAISDAVVAEKTAAIRSTGAEILLGGDLGCLMNMAGKLKREGSAIRAYHTVELLAGRGGEPALGEER